MNDVYMCVNVPPTFDRTLRLFFALTIVLCLPKIDSESSRRSRNRKFRMQWMQMPQLVSQWARWVCKINSRKVNGELKNYSRVRIKNSKVRMIRMNQCCKGSEKLIIFPFCLPECGFSRRVRSEIISSFGCLEASWSRLISNSTNRGAPSLANKARVLVCYYVTKMIFPPSTFASRRLVWW